MFVVCMRRYLLRINVFMSHNFSRISQHLDLVSKSLKTFILFFIGTPNASTWCSISRCWLVGMKYELLLMRLRSHYSRFRLHNFSLSPKCKWELPSDQTWQTSLLHVTGQGYFLWTESHHHYTMIIWWLPFHDYSLHMSTMMATSH